MDVCGGGGGRGGVGGAITAAENHLIREIMSCHGYQSSFYVIGWICAA